LVGSLKWLPNDLHGLDAPTPFLLVGESGG
jgi:hypothetical protein